MIVLSLKNNFGKYFEQEKYNGNTRYLFIKITSVEGHTIKKKIKESDKVNIKNIKYIEEATFGINKETSINVISKVYEIIEKNFNTSHLINVNEEFSLFAKSLVKLISPKTFNFLSNVKVNTFNNNYLDNSFENAPQQAYDHILNSFFKCYIAYLLNQDKGAIEKKKESLNEVYTDILVNNNKSKSIHYELSNIIFNKMSGLNDNRYDSIKLKISTALKIKFCFREFYPNLMNLDSNSNSLLIQYNFDKSQTIEKKEIFPISNIKNDYYPITSCSINDLVNELHMKIPTTIMTIITLEKFKKCGGKIYTSSSKSIKTDKHDLVAESNIKTSNWLFLYNNVDKKIALDFKKRIINICDTYNVCLINMNVVKYFLIAMKLLRNKFILLH